MSDSLNTLKYSSELKDLPVEYAGITVKEALAKIREIKTDLAEQLVILGHNYQSGEIISVSDHCGDSYELAKIAAETSARYIVFCGVIFMAESADILTSASQQVILPAAGAACPMAGMAELVQVKKAWDELQTLNDDRLIIPITYMNSYADLKAFCGEKNGAVCTSSNARKLFEWAFREDCRVFFFPDEHLGRNTAHELGLEEEKLVVWNPWDNPQGGVTEEELLKAQVLLWKGECQVHQRFQPEDVENMRENHPEAKIIVHPECSREVVELADRAGSTSQIISAVEESPPGSCWGIGTECNLTDHLQKIYPGKKILQLGDRSRATCRAMSMITPAHLLWALEQIEAGQPVNVIKVDPEIAAQARKALDQMIEVTGKDA